MVQTSTRFSINITLFLKGCWLACGGALRAPSWAQTHLLGSREGLWGHSPRGLKKKARCLGPCWVSGWDGASRSPSRPPVLQGARGTPELGHHFQPSGADGCWGTDRQTDSTGLFRKAVSLQCLERSYNTFPDYVCTQTTAAGKLCNPTQGGTVAGGRKGWGGPAPCPMAPMGPQPHGFTPKTVAQ